MRDTEKLLVLLSRGKCHFGTRNMCYEVMDTVTCLRLIILVIRYSLALVSYFVCQYTRSVPKQLSKPKRTRNCQPVPSLITSYEFNRLFNKYILTILKGSNKSFVDTDLFLSGNQTELVDKNMIIVTGDQ